MRRMISSLFPGQWRPVGALTSVLLVFICSITPLSTGATAHEAAPLALLEPTGEAYFGFNLDWNEDSAIAVGQRLGLQPSSYVDFFSFPLTAADQTHLDRFLGQVEAVQGIAVVTLEPTVPLEAVTPQLAGDLATILATYNERGIPILLRFAHEMNGSWYAWSQQPTAYIAAFRVMSSAVHANAPLTGMLWAPNNGAGYPFSGGAFEAAPDDANFSLLDTDHDGILTEADDPYAPYYPGDDAVDWVGTSLYHWGNQYPWGENELPEPNAFIAMLTGTYDGLDGDHTAIPDFYADYAEGRSKPLAIVETAAFYRPDEGGADELAIKQGWWRQVLSAETLSQFPAIRMVNWFEWQKEEAEVGNAVVDWSVTSSKPIVTAFRRDLPVEQLLFAPLSATHRPTTGGPR
jgi:hypothetical protein